MKICPKCGFKDPKVFFSEGFDEFWRIYPRKVGKFMCQKAWSKLKPDMKLRAALIIALQAHKSSPSWTKDRGVYIPHPATWLNQRRWEDEVSQPQGYYENKMAAYDQNKMTEKMAELDRIREVEYQRIHGGL